MFVFTILKKQLMYQELSGMCIVSVLKRRFGAVVDGVGIEPSHLHELPSGVVARLGLLVRNRATSTFVILTDTFSPLVTIWFRARSNCHDRH